MINRQFFFNYVRNHLFGGKLKQSQVDGLSGFLDYFENNDYKDTRWLAYILATVHHETDMKFQPIEEYGKGKGKPYGIPDKETGKTYYGRGYVQLTWKENYNKFGLVKIPDAALTPTNALFITFKGMVDGDFTGKKLSDYFNKGKEDWVGARRIINGTDKANLIAHYALQFYAAISPMR